MSAIVFITGATSGFGLACAELFAAKGYHLIINGRREERLRATATDLQTRYGINVLTAAFDVSDQQQVKKVISELPAEWDAIDVLINNAGLAAGRDYFEEASLADWDQMIDTNIKGFLYVAQAIAKKMAIRKKGHIINIGSTAAKLVYEKGNTYCATKFAVDALSQAMRIDLLRHGIKVTAVNPGAAETEFSLVRFKGDAATAAKVYEGYKPLQAEDVANVIYYAATLPEHVCINELTVTCLQQADSVHLIKK
ncbi:MAG: SDR family NAD(P)-dependent oxidoreductase [Sphingomonadales bacterium]